MHIASSISERKTTDAPQKPSNLGIIVHLGLSEANAGERDEAGEVVIHVLEDEVERGREGDTRHHEPLKPDDVGVVEAAK